MLGGFRCLSAMPETKWRSASCLCWSALAWRTAAESSSDESFERSRRVTRTTTASNNTTSTARDTTTVVMPSTLRDVRQLRPPQMAKSQAAGGSHLDLPLSGTVAHLDLAVAVFDQVAVSLAGREGGSPSRR